MIKKYLPLILLLAAAVLLYWVKTHQRGKSIHIPVETNVPVPDSAPSAAENEPFSRNVQHVSYSKHARCRMDCRHIDESEVKEIIETGTINYNKIEESVKGKTYPLEGITHDKQHVRIVVAPHAEQLVVVTVIDLDTEWSCNCN